MFKGGENIGKHYDDYAETMWSAEDILRPVLGPFMRADGSLLWQIEQLGAFEVLILSSIVDREISEKQSGQPQRGGGPVLERIAQAEKCSVAKALLVQAYERKMLQCARRIAETIPKGFGKTPECQGFEQRIAAGEDTTHYLPTHLQVFTRLSRHINDVDGSIWKKVLKVIEECENPER